jgi:hypothetical protein
LKGEPACITGSPIALQHHHAGWQLHQFEGVQEEGSLTGDVDQVYQSEIKN